MKEQDYSQKKEIRKLGLWGIIGLLIMVLALVLSSCGSTKYVPVESVRVEYRDKLQRDSVYLKDSVYIRERGDTVFMERWHTEYVKQLRVDSFHKFDSIQVPYPVEVIKKVPKELSRWQGIKMEAGGIAITVLFVILGYLIFKLVRNVKTLGWKAALKLIFKL